MAVWAERYVVKVSAGVGYDEVLPFSFTKKKDAEKALGVLAESFNLGTQDLYIDELFSIPSTGINDFIVTMKSIAEDGVQRKS